MGNRISKINKHRFLAVEEFMKNDIFFSNERVRFNLEMGTRGGTYIGAHSLLRFSKIMTLTPLQTGEWWRSL